jgi:hypothetical protein
MVLLLLVAAFVSCTFLDSFVQFLPLNMSTPLGAFGLTVALLPVVSTVALSPFDSFFPTLPLDCSLPLLPLGPSVLQLPHNSFAPLLLLDSSALLHVASFPSQA